MENQRQKEILTNLECVNDKKSSQQLPSCVMATGDSLFCKMCSPLFCFEQEKALKNFSKKLYTNTIKKREEAETKNSVCNLKKCLKTSTNPRTVKRYEAGMCIGLFSFLIIV